MGQVISKAWVASKANRKLLPVGTAIVSVHGETNDIEGEEVQTGPMAHGVIRSVLANQETCYSVEFADSGVSILLTPTELTDAAAYRIKSLPASTGTDEDDVPATKALLAVVLAVQKGAAFFRAESSVKEAFGMPKEQDWMQQCETLLFQVHGERAKACGLSLNTITLKGIAELEVPEGVLKTRFEDLPAAWVFNPYRGWRTR